MKWIGRNKIEKLVIDQIKLGDPDESGRRRPEIKKGSEFEIKYIKIKSIKIGDYIVKDVIAVVPLRDDINDLLIGIGFLKKFKEVLWSLNSNLMRFYK